MDTDCTLLVLSTPIDDIKSEKQIHHFLHGHPIMVLSKNKKDDQKVYQYCRICGYIYIKAAQVLLLPMFVAEMAFVREFTFTNHVLSSHNRSTISSIHTTLSPCLNKLEVREYEKLVTSGRPMLNAV